MDTRSRTRSGFVIGLGALLLGVPASLPAAGGGDILSGPYSLTLRGGGRDDSATVGLAGRADFLNPAVNVHLFGVYDWLSSDRGIGEIDNQRYGGGVALSHTWPKRANVYVGASAINEIGETFSHVYGGVKYQVASHGLLSIAYGAGLESAKKIQLGPNTQMFAEAADWLKGGGVVVWDNGVKANVYYYLTDPGGEGISGIDGELTWPLGDQWKVGLRASADFSRRQTIDDNWKGYAFVGYSFGGGARASVMEVALDTNSPVEYPRVLRGKPVNIAPALTISPATATVDSCSDADVLLTASGGVPPYTWSNSDGGLLTPNFNGNNNQANWNEDCIDGGTDIVTVRDSRGQTAQAKMISD